MGTLTHVLPQAHAESGNLNALALAEVYAVKPPMMAQILGGKPPGPVQDPYFGSLAAQDAPARGPLYPHP
jgi:hypothetical protein